MKVIASQHAIGWGRAITAMVLMLAAGSAFCGASTVSALDATTTQLDGSTPAMQFTVVRSGDTSYAVTVGYNTVDGTARAGIDYSSSSGQATIAAGASSVVISVPVLGHMGEQPDKQFVLHLSTSTTAAPPRSFSEYQQICCTLGAVNDVLRSADINQDGKVDLVVVGGDNGPQVFLNTTTNGATTATFAAVQPFSGAAGNSSIAALADLNGDLKPDLIAGSKRNPSSNTIGTAWVSLNGTVTGSSSVGVSGGITLDIGSRPNGISVADFDGDGLPDLAISYEFNNGTALWKNQTPVGGATPQFGSRTDLEVGGCSETLTADVNTDGKPDLFCNTGRVLLNVTPTGATQPAFSSAYTGQPDLFRGCKASADINSDGKPDVVCLGPAKVILNTTPSGSSAASFTAPQNANPNSAVDIGVADVNGDGLPDILLPFQGNDTIGVLLNTTVANSLTATFDTLSYEIGLSPKSVAIGDFNGDGLPDLALAQSGEAQRFLSILLATENMVSISDADAVGTIKYTVSPPPSGGGGYLSIWFLIAIGLGGGVRWQARRLG